MRIAKYFIAAVLFLALASCSDDEVVPERKPTGVNNNANIVTTQPEVTRLEFPKLKGGNSLVIIHKTSDKYDPDGVNYSVEWDYERKSQRWTAYMMTTGFGGNAGYYGVFEEDPDLPSYTRFDDTNAMYSGSGFTRGHICPSADRQYSRIANHQTFYYSNMQPQYYNFNAGNGYTGIWVRMESQVRKWVSSNDTLYVVKGGTIDREDQILMRISKSWTNERLIVPKYFFMALLAKNSQGYKALGFWAEHLSAPYKGTEKLSDYVCSIDELEELTGIDFFCNLPDAIEEEKESLSRDKVIRAWGLN